MGSQSPTFNPLDGTYRTDINRYNLGNVDIVEHQVALNPCERDNHLIIKKD